MALNDLPTVQFTMTRDDAGKAALLLDGLDVTPHVVEMALHVAPHGSTLRLGLRVAPEVEDWPMDSVSIAQRQEVDEITLAGEIDGIAAAHKPSFGSASLGKKVVERLAQLKVL